MKLSKKKAKELSLKKWEYIVKNNGLSEGLLDKYPELIYLEANCGFCEKYEDCPICPLALPGDIYCSSPSHPFRAWSCNPNKENAQAVLDLILKT